MRVLHLLGNLKPSGMERMLVSAAPYFKEFGCTSIVVGQNIYGTEHPFRGDLTQAGYDVITIDDLSRKPGVALWSKILRETKPDVIHIHPDKNYLLSTLSAKALCPRAKIVRTIHNLFRPPTKRSRIKRRFEFVLADLIVSNLVGVSPEVVDLERSRHRPISLAENWVSDRFFEAPASKRTDDGTTNVLVVGNCSPIKNHLAVLEAVAEQEAFRLFHVGAEHSASETETRLLDRLQSDGKLEVRGVADPLEYMSAATVYAMPSLREGASIALLEALVYGLPCVVSDAPGFTWAAEFPGVQFVRHGDDWAAAIADISGCGGPHLLRKQRSSTSRFAAAEGARRYVNLYAR